MPRFPDAGSKRDCRGDARQERDYSIELRSSLLANDPWLTSGLLLAIFSRIGEKSEAGMEGGAQKKRAPRSLMDLKRDLYPPKSRADLK